MNTIEQILPYLIFQQQEIRNLIKKQQFQEIMLQYDKGIIY